MTVNAAMKICYLYVNLNHDSYSYHTKISQKLLFYKSISFWSVAFWSKTHLCDKNTQKLIRVDIFKNNSNGDDGFYVFYWYILNM